MIYDAKGRPFYRKIGFEGGLVAETSSEKRETVYCVSWLSIDVSETQGAEADTQEVKYGE